MGGHPHLPDGAFSNAWYDYEYCSVAPRISKLEDDVSPKSVITDIRFISPASSSSSNVDPPPRAPPLSDATLLPQPAHHDRGYSISDGELSDDPDTFNSVESYPERAKVCTTITSLEPKTRSLPLKEAIKTNSITCKLGESAAPAQRGRDEENRGTEDSPVRSTEFGAINSFECPGTPPRIFSVWQSQLVTSDSSLRSPDFEKGKFVSLSPDTSKLADHQFNRGVLFQPRFLSGPLHYAGNIISRPSPSKWDDAEKWIASPVHHECSAQPQPPRSPSHLSHTGRRHSVSGHCQPVNCGGGSPDFATLSLTNSAEKPFSEHNVAGSGESQSASQKKRFSKALSFGDHIIPKRSAFDVSNCSNASQTTTQTCLEPRNVEKISFESTNEVPEIDVRRSERSTGCLIDNSNMDKEILKHALTVTESTKEIGSQPYIYASTRQDGHLLIDPPPERFDQPHKHSRTTRTTFSVSSPARHNTPAAARSTSGTGWPATHSFGSLTKAGSSTLLELQTWHLAKLGLVCDDRKFVTPAWSTREEEDMECSVRLVREYQCDTISGPGHEPGSCVEDHDDPLVTAWGNAERMSQHDERCDEEKARINAWVELQTTWAEAEMQKIEMKIEKMRARALEKMADRVAVARKKAMEMRAAAHARRAGSAAKIAQQVELIRIAGRDGGVVPVVSISPFTSCFRA